MLKRLFTERMLQPADLSPITPHHRVVGTFNPGAVDFAGKVIVIVRVAEQPIEQRPGFLPSPRFDDHGCCATDWLDEAHQDQSDPRRYVDRRTGLMRLRFVSYFKVLTSTDGKHFDSFAGPIITPQGIYEEYGIEDPRITRIDQTYYITYVAVSRHGVTTALLSTTDFQNFQRHGIIFCPENKDVLLFPEKINGSYLAMHRPVPAMTFTPPAIWLARSPDLLHWGNHQQLVGSDMDWQIGRIGGGTPPIRTDLGWLTFYHGSDKSRSDAGPGVYCAGALLLDLQNPHKIVGHSVRPVMSPQLPFEKQGFVSHVVFPTAVVQRGHELWVYYGAADQSTAVVAFSLNELLNTLTA
jgi:predicted GH43/DUF377 family glycosyl hydrolase